jgi:hypothetical protein
MPANNESHSSQNDKSVHFSDKKLRDRKHVSEILTSEKSESRKNEYQRSKGPDNLVSLK